jgi:hypothetical protein
MTAPQQSPPDAGTSRRTRRLLIVGAVVAVLGVLALGFAIWYIFFRPAGPPPVGPDAPLIPESWLSGPAVLALAANLFA